MKLPIRIRLAVVYCLALALIVAGIEIGAYLCTQAAFHSIVDHELETRLAGIDDHLTRHLGKFSRDRMRVELDAHPAFYPAYLSVRAVSGELLFGGSAMRGLSLSGLPRIADVDNQDHPLRILSVRRIILGQPYDLALATDLQLPAAMLHRLWLILLLSMPPLLLVCASAGYWISGRALRPVQEIIAAARSIDTRRLAERVPAPATADEVQQLAETFNQMLGRIEAGFRRMREFTANASHELRTPAAVIRAAAEVALLHPRPSQKTYREALERILRVSEHESALIENMLELSRMEAETDRIRFEAVDLCASLAEACDQMIPLAEMRGIDLSFVSRIEGASVIGDAEQLRRLWLSLLDNAVKYTLAGGAVRATVLERDAAPCVEISDTGIGIAPEHHPLLFQRFYRVDKAHSRRNGGAGLGLAIASEIANVHQAKLEVESEPGTGSLFRVVLPLYSSAGNSPVVSRVLS